MLLPGSGVRERGQGPGLGMRGFGSLRADRSLRPLSVGRSAPRGREKETPLGRRDRRWLCPAPASRCGSFF